jgi:hypothetical protein
MTGFVVLLFSSPIFPSQFFHHNPLPSPNTLRSPSPTPHTSTFLFKKMTSLGQTIDRVPVKLNHPEHTKVGVQSYATMLSFNSDSLG